MLQRTLATFFLLTLLVAQTLSGLCRLRCDHAAETAHTPSCHTMPMAETASHVQASAPCAIHSCPTDTTLLASTSTHEHLQADLSPDQPQGTLPHALQTLSLSPHLFFDPPNPTPPVPPASLRRTTLRL